jgi:hypothetical protein
MGSIAAIIPSRLKATNSRAAVGGSRHGITFRETEPGFTDGDHDLGDEELQPVASSTSDAAVRDAGEEWSRLARRVRTRER